MSSIEERIDKTMAKKKKDKETMVSKTLHRKLKIEQHKPRQIPWGKFRCSGS